MVKECKLRRLNEKKKGEDDEAYNLRKLEEIKKKKFTDNSTPALIVLENTTGNDFRGVEIWSTDSEDDEVRKHTHGRAFVAKDGSKFAGSCLMVTNDVSQMTGYTTNGGYEETKERRDEKCFAAKPVCEQINECDQLIKKVKSILESLKIPISNYEIELNDL